MLKIIDIAWRCDRASLYNASLIATTKVVTTRKIKALQADGVLPSNWRERCTAFTNVLIAKADVLLYPSQNTLMQAQEIFEELTDAIAILAFVPHGVEFWGVRYEASLNGSSEA